MNVFFLLAIVFALFVIIDMLTAKMFRLKRSLLRNISLGMLCVLTVSCAVGGGLSLAGNNAKAVKTLYNAYSYLLQGNIDKAAENAARVESPHADIINLLADCWRDHYASVFINSDDLKNSGKLNDDLYAQTDGIYSLSRQMTGLDAPMLTDDEAHARLNEIAETCFSLLKISEKKEVEFLSGFRRDSMINSDNYYDVDDQLLSEMLLETPKDRELLRFSVNYHCAAGSLDIAEEHAYQLLEVEQSVENIVLYTDVIAQKLLDDVSISTYDPDDREIAALMQKAQEAEKTAYSYEEGNPRRDEILAKANEYNRQANGVKAQRIINWLTAHTPLFGDSSGIIDLQLSRLYAAAGNDAKANQILLALIRREHKIHSSSPIKPALAQLGDVYYDASASDDEIAAAISAVQRAPAFLSDSVLSRGYSQFLNNMLRYERVSIYISRVDASDYPTVRAYLNVSGRKDGVDELASDFVLEDFTFSDNRFDIPSKNVKRIEDDLNNFISIALVVDASGSMDGSRNENAKQAVEACIRNMRPETQELSIVTFDSDAFILTMPTNDREVLRRLASQINASGGTDIPSGLTAGVESLRAASGVKAIILMSDGEDGNPEMMEEAIAHAVAEDVAVFTISMGEADSEYLADVARRTGGTHLHAATEHDLVNVYTALQSFIVNNYCFEYTVTDDVNANPRILTVGLEEYQVSSSRSYGYGGVVLTQDGSYITRGDSGSLRLLYCEPAVVSAKDAEIGTPVFLSAVGVTEEAKLFVNGDEITNAKTAGDSAIVFTLKGSYPHGALDISVRLPDGTSGNSDQLLSIGKKAGENFTGQTILLGRNGNTIYADYVEQKDDYTLKLSGNVILNGFLRTVSDVTIRSDSPIAASGGRITLESGSILGGKAAYVDFSSGNMGADYGQTVFGGRSAKVLDSFRFYFDDYSIDIDTAQASLSLPGFGEVYGDAQYDGSELIITVDSGSLQELENNLNYALNNIPLPESRVSNAMQIITGFSPQMGYEENRSSGLSVSADEITIVVKKNFMSVKGTGTVSGHLGPIELSEGKLTIDTDNAANMYAINGTANLESITSVTGVEGWPTITITSAGLYPDTIVMNASGLTINTEGISECFTNNQPPVALDGSLSVNFPLSISEEPYRGQIAPLLKDVVMNCDKIAFIASSDSSQNGIKAYNSSDPNHYILFMKESVVIPIYDVDELFLFGSNLGGEISGTATISDWAIELSVDVDGHLDNRFYGIKHTGRANLTASFGRGSRPDNTIPVTLSYGGTTFTYHAAAAGNIHLENGFQTYAEDYGQ